MDKKYIFWLDDISVLYKDNKYLEFFPSKRMTKVEQLNALTRMAIYFMTVMLLFSKDDKWIIIGVVIICATVFMHRVFERDSKGKLDEHLRLQHQENFDPKIRDKSELKLNDTVFDKDSRPRYHKDIELGRRDIDSSPKIEAGYYDFSNKLHIGEKYDPPKYRRHKDTPLYNLDQKIDYAKGTCRRPSVNNPFMNPQLLDFNDGEKPVACNSDDKDINEDIVDKFNKNLYRNVDDLFETHNSQRQFYTIPDTSIPNQQTEFAEWLWKPKVTCKEDQASCLRHSDLRFER